MKFVNLKVFPWYIFLLPLFFIWHKMNEYFGLFPIRFGTRFLIYYIALAIIIFLIGNAIFKNAIKAGVWSTSILIIFLFWGSFQDYLKSLPTPAFFYSYRFLFSLLVIFIVGITIILRKKKRPPQKIHYFFILLFSLFLLAECSISIYKWINNQSFWNDLAHYNKPLQLKLAKIDDSQKPDIFFIVFDEYASSASLKKYLNYDNSEMDSMVQKKGLYLVKSSKSNYNYTPFSLGSTFNLQYFNISLENKVPVPKYMLQAQASFTNNFLQTVLEKEGYKIKNWGLLDLKNHPAKGKILLQHYNLAVFHGETIWSRVKKDIWWYVQK
jgi:hypothetical protein